MKPKKGGNYSINWQWASSAMILVLGVFCLLAACGGPNSPGTTGDPETIKYTVTFDAVGGTPIPPSQTVSRGGKVAEPAPMVYFSSLYGFVGWSRSRATGYNRFEEWDFDVDTVTADITLYAWWQYGYTLTVNFEANGGTPAPSQQNIVGGSKVVMPPPMSKSSYGFDGWYKEAACINQWNFASDVVTKNITLYAKWGSNYFTVNFEANGGTPAPNQQNIVNGRTVVIPPDMIKASYSFGGWYKEAALTNQWDFTSDVVTGNITLYAKWEPATVVPGANWNAKMRWLDTNVQSDGAYIIEFDSDENISPITFSYSGKNNISITMKGIGAVRTLSLSTSGSLFTVGSGVTLILDENIELRGSTQISSGGNLFLNHGARITGGRVSVSGGTFTMNGGEISGNTVSSSGGGGVFVDSNGTFTMNDGEISGNTVSSYNYGGGVYVGSGTFTMNGGVISGNTASRGGGGVYVGSGTFTMNDGEISGNTVSSNDYGGGGVYVGSGTFTMSGGTISGNTASFSNYGGGVYVASSSYEGSGTFNMSGGEISGNTASLYGGGVYVNGSIFNKTDGTIFGYSEGDSDSNVVKNSNVVQQNRGHAIHFNHSNTSYIMGKDTTSGPGDNLSFDGTGNPPDWSGEWDY